MNDELCEVVITAPSPEWLAEFTRQLVADRLCAGGHSITAIHSIYRWQGEIYDRQEGRVALHTRQSLAHLITGRANREHPYEVPCVVVLPIKDGNPAYLQWIRDETKPAASGEDLPR